MKFCQFGSLAQIWLIPPLFFMSMVLLGIPTAVQQMTGIEGFNYQASSFRDFAAMDSSSFNPNAQFIVDLAE